MNKFFFIAITTTLFIFQSEVMPPNKNINDMDILIYDELVYKSFFSEIQR